MDMFAHRRLLAVILVGAAVVTAGCGESKQDKAQKTVCNARADIKKQVDELRSLTLATASVDGVKANVQAIQDDLKKIVNAQGTLSDARRSQVKSATDAFTGQVTSIAQGVTSNLSLSEAGTKLKSATQQLASAYQQSLGKIDCS